MNPDASPHVPIEASAAGRRNVPSLLRLEAVANHARVGGKAIGLAKLIALGLDVPAGFVIVDASPGRLPEALGAWLAELGDGPVAVRSSAIGEDSAEASFAGQYETVLDVRGEQAVRRAVERCLASLDNARAGAYRDERIGEEEAPGVAMSVVVQRMAPARAAGVLFTVDPVSGRRARPVIDAIEGLGEALVSGAASPDHYVMDRSGDIVRSDLTGDTPILHPDECRALVVDALEAEAREGIALDLEWAIDDEGRIHWLQGRPITTLGADPNELDTPANPSHVYTRCNVGEMFPGACTPLSFSFTARGIDVGLQRMHVRVGIQDEVLPGAKFIAMFHGHLFIDLSFLGETATQALGSSTEQMALSVCGRPLDELDLTSAPPPPLPRRIANGLRYVGYLFSRGRARRDLKRLVAELRLPEGETARDTWAAIDVRFDAIYVAMDDHLISSASSGILTPTLLGVVAGGETPKEEHHAEVASRLASVEGVESADIVAGAERLQTAILAEPEGRQRFVDATSEAALEWLRGTSAGEAGREFARYLARHGHRAIKELELRQPEWREDPTPLVTSIQVGLRQRGRPASERARGASPVAKSDGLAMRILTRMAREAVRAREETKSGLVHVTTRFKEAYRRLARQLVDEGRLPDADAAWFLTHAELGRLADGETALAGLALARRDVFPYQESLQFEDVFQGAAEPLVFDPGAMAGADGVTGAAVSRGRVVGRARVITCLEDAEALEQGEILIAPITDVGWTPYFSLIAGLVTDVGSAVSHGAVVAREYGLPAVVNTRFATRIFENGDLVELDGDRGIVRRLS